MRRLKNNTIFSGDMKEYKITSLLEDDKGNGFIKYTARNHPDLDPAYFPKDDVNYLVQEFCPNYITQRTEDNKIIIPNDMSGDYNNKLNDFFSDYRDFVEGNKHSVFGEPLDCLNINNTAYILYNYDDWALDNYIHKLPQSGELDIISGKYVDTEGVQQELGDDALNSLLNQFPDLLDELGPDELITKLQQKFYKLLKEILTLEIEDKKPLQLDGKKLISLSKVNKELKNYGEWNILKYLVTDNDTFYRFNYGNTGGIVMCHKGKFLREWNTWMT